MKFVIVTGLSGAGKTTSLKILENIGFFCVDNLPSVLLTKFADLCFQGRTDFDKVAVGIDVRGRSFFDALEDALSYMEQAGYPVEVLFLGCDKNVLINRYNFTRYIHPLASEGGTIGECIEKEVKLLSEIRRHATFLLDTTKMQPKNMKSTLERLYREPKDHKVKIFLQSFGYKRGIPLDADYVFDARFLPNPYRDPMLRPHSGLEAPVRDYLIGFDDFGTTVEMICEQLRFLIPRYAASGKSEMFYAIGCTGGFHRSVLLTETVAEQLRKEGFEIVSDHRDLPAEAETWKDPTP